MAEPVSFDELNLPEFPTHALPEILQHFVEAESIATQTPKDLAALLALAVISATIARKVEVEPRVGWPEPVNLYVTISLPPGNRKSAVSSDTTKPLRDFESIQIESQKKTVAIAKAERRQAKKRMEKLELDYAKGGNRESLIEAKEIAVRLAEEAEPVLPRLLVDDVTPEKLEIILSEQGGRIASISAEGGVFDLMAGRYSKNAAPNFEVYLKGHAGDDMQIDRVGRESVKVKKPAITCAYTVQPQVIQGMLDNPTFRGRGLLARFLYAAPSLHFSPLG